VRRGEAFQGQAVESTVSGARRRQHADQHIEPVKEARPFVIAGRQSTPSISLRLRA